MVDLEAVVVVVADMEAGTAEEGATARTAGEIGETHGLGHIDRCSTRCSKMNDVVSDEKFLVHFMLSVGSQPSHVRSEEDYVYLMWPSAISMCNAASLLPIFLPFGEVYINPTTFLGNLV